MMDMRETLSVAIDALRANKLRAILTSLGVIIGSACIVLVVTIALTSQKYVIGQIEAIGSNMVYTELVNASSKSTPLNYEITLDDMNAVKANVPGVTEVAGTRELPMSVVVAGKERPINLIGVTFGYQAIRRLVIMRGRYFDSSDMEQRSKVCLITKKVADRVFGLAIYPKCDRHSPSRAFVFRGIRPTHLPRFPKLWFHPRPSGKTRSRRHSSGNYGGISSKGTLRHPLILRYQFIIS